MKILAVLCVILSVATTFYYYNTELLKSKNCLLESEKNAYKGRAKNLEEEIERYNQRQLEASSTITRIREQVKYIKTDCNCYNQPIPDSIANILQNNKHRAY